jgi:hypothetical protein
MKKENMRNEKILGIFVIIFLASIFVMPVSAQSTSIPIKLDLTVESSTISVGEKATITVRLLDENDKAVVTKIDVPVNLSTNLGYVPSSVIIHAETALSGTEFRSGDRGIAVISAKSEGLIGDTTSIAVMSLPLLHIDSPSDGETVNTNTIMVSGTVVGDQGAVIESVTVNGDLALGTSPEGGFTSWKKKISLQEGQNKITVEATDVFGNTKTETITVVYNAPTPPLTPTTILNGGHRPTPTPMPVPTGSISITTIPTGAEVYLDDSSEGITPITLKDVTVGYHKVKVIKEGYRSETSNIYLGAGITKELGISLKPIIGSIAVSSTPPGASVYLDDVYMNAITTCMLSEVVVGQHTIKLTKSGYFDVIRLVSVSVGETVYLHENLAGYGSLSISTNPSGASVYLDGNYKGETPTNISKVVVGNHTIKLTKFGYDDVIRTVSASVGETHSLHENVTGYGALRISSYPSGASVYLDGVYKGETPLAIDKVVVGSHSYKLTKSYHEDVDGVIDVSAGKLTTVNFSLSHKVWVTWLPETLTGLAFFVGIFLAIFRWLIPRLSGEKYLLFSLDPSYRPHLKEGDVDEKLKKVFEDNELSLSREPKLSKIAEKQWKIEDGEMHYNIEDTEKRLNVYKKE